MDLPDLQAMDNEHQAWTAWCEEFKKQVGASLNEDRFTPLTKLIALWGEELVALRQTQTAELRAKALTEAREIIQQLKGSKPCPECGHEEILHVARGCNHLHPRCPCKLSGFEVVQLRSRLQREKHETGQTR